jgi:hypothetical protein
MDPRKLFSIHSLGLKSGGPGLNIPELPDTATEEEIFFALARLSEAREQIRRQRAVLAREAEGLFDHSIINSPAGPENTPDSAEKRSIILRKALSGIKGSLTNESDEIKDM